MLLELTSDNYFLTERLKEIDENYYLVFNLIKNKYELHCKNQPFCSYCLTYPHPSLDERLLELTRKSRRENVKQLLKEIEEENEKLIKKEEKKVLEEEKFKLQEKGIK